MSWFRAVAVQPNTLLLQGIPAALWVTEHIQLHTGLVVPVSFLRCSPDGTSTLIELSVTHQMPYEAETFFMLSNGTFTPPPPLASTTAAAADGPPTYGYEGASTEYPPLPGAAAGAATTTTVAAMDMSDDGSDAGGGLVTVGGGGGDGSHERPLPLSLIERILFGFVALVITFGAMAMTMGVAYSIGNSNSTWLLVLIWTLVAVPVIAVILAFFLGTFIIADSEKGFGGLIIWMLMFFVFSNAMGIPFAWAAANVKATERYMDDANELLVNTFNQSQTVTSFTKERYHYIRLVEQEWSLDWRLSQQRAVTVTESETNDDGTVTVYGTFTYCAVPIVYNGVVPPTLTTRLWAMCANARAGACTVADGATCGWNLPLNSVYLQVMNQNEMFYRAADVDDDFNRWSKVMELVPPAAGGNVPVVFSDGPDAMEVNQDAAQVAFDVILYLTLALWLLWSFFYAALCQDEWDDSNPALAICCCICIFIDCE